MAEGRQKLLRSKDELLKWAKGNCRPVEGIINSKTYEIAQLQAGEGILDVKKLGQLQKEVKVLIAQDELHLRQRAKMEWLKGGGGG